MNNNPDPKKVKYLLEKTGWTQLWHVDNWVSLENAMDPHCDIDRAGCSTDAAYASEMHTIEANETITKKLEELKNLHP